LPGSRCCPLAWPPASNGGTARNANDPDIGQPVRIIALQDESMARVHYRGTEWQARLTGHGLAAGAPHITGRDGNVLLSSTHTETR
jgi:membrane protein implicated in regulation of membrane protease activity